MPTDSTGNTFSYVESAPMPLFGKGAPPLLKMMTRQSDPLASPKHHTRGDISPSATPKHRRTVKVLSKRQKIPGTSVSQAESAIGQVKSTILNSSLLENSVLYLSDQCFSLPFQDVSSKTSEIPPSPIIEDTKRSSPTMGDTSAEPPILEVEKEITAPPLTSAPDVAGSEIQLQMPESISAPGKCHITIFHFQFSRCEI